MSIAPLPSFTATSPRRPLWRWVTPFLLVALSFPLLLWLPWQAQRNEAGERQEQLIADTLWVEQAIRFQLGRDEESLRLVAREISGNVVTPDMFAARLAPLLRSSREIKRIDWFNAQGDLVASTDPGLRLPRQLTPAVLHPSERIPRYLQPAGTPDRLDFDVPLLDGEHFRGRIIARYSTAAILDELVPWWFAQDNEITLSDNMDELLARRSAGGPGRGVYTHSRALDLPGVNLWLRTNSLKGTPKLLPNLLVVAVMALTLGLLWSLWALWRDVNRRLAAEQALRQQVAFRTAMENSLQTGMRARDLEGRVTYVNPAFCRMVGYSAEQLVGMKPPMPYWAPEAMEDYQERFSQVLAGKVAPQHETIFQRANGERFPVLIFESPLVDEHGRQTGWMGSLLDISDLRRAEDLARAQEEKVEASARLASMGEMASALAHELNQPLAAISSYTAGALNMLAGKDGKVDAEPLRAALEKAGAQAQRAGQIIRSVHAFVKKREAPREAIALAELVDSITPLIDLQARPHFVSLVVSVPEDLPRVMADRVLLEQVLLNLTRNAIESMRDVPSVRRLLRVSARRNNADAAFLAVEVTDQGHGIPDDVAERLFSPFFSTKAEGMGMGLNICRTAVELHGGELTWRANPGGGTIFRFTLPVIPES